MCSLETSRPGAAFVTSPGLFLGAEEAGLVTRVVEDPSALLDEVRRLKDEGFVLIAVTEDLVSGRSDRIVEEAERLAGDVSLVVVPVAPQSKLEFLEGLRSRFSVALGIDIWKVSAKKAGLDVS